MNLITAEIIDKINDQIISPFKNINLPEILLNTPALCTEIRSMIPENKRISYGMVHVVRQLSDYLFRFFSKENIDYFETAAKWLECSTDAYNTGVSMEIIACYGLNNYQEVLPYFKMGAGSGSWEAREMVQIFFRRLIKKYPGEMQIFLLELVQSQDENIRRFAGETLRPVAENKWFHKNPEYPLAVLKFLFNEKKAYPATSVGNNLSDLSRKNPGLIFKIVAELVENKDKNSYRIAYRACRNLVKTEPHRVMAVLGIDTYKYKDRIYHDIEN